MDQVKMVDSNDSRVNKMNDFIGNVIDKRNELLEKQKNETIQTDSMKTAAIPKKISQQEAIEIVKQNSPQEFEKFGEFDYEIATQEHIIITSINGQQETKNTANPGDYILTGPAGEKYIIKSETFKKRYQDFGNGRAKAMGKCYGNVYIGEPISFMAIWNEEMICNSGDYLVSPDKEFSEAYRIEKSVFEKTYRPVKTYPKTDDLMKEFLQLSNNLHEANSTQVKSRIIKACEDLEAYIKKNPQFYPEFFKLIIQLPKKYRFATNPYTSTISGQLDFPTIVEWLESTNTNLFSIIPCKEYSLPKYKPFDTTHEDKIFTKIHTEFSGTDDMRPVMMGINFNEHGVVSTAAHVMLFTPYRSKAHKPYGNFCYTKKCFEQEEAVESGRYPQWRQVIPKNHIHRLFIDTQPIFNFLKNSIELGVLPSASKGVAFNYPEGDQENKIGFNAKFLLTAIQALLELGHKDLEISFSAPNRGALIYPSGQHGKIDDLTTDFALVMPILLNGSDKYDIIYLTYNFETNCTFIDKIPAAYCFNDIPENNQEATNAMPIIAPESINESNSSSEIESQIELLKETLPLLKGKSKKEVKENIELLTETLELLKTA